MFNQVIIDKLISFILGKSGINDKDALSAEVKSEFNLVQDRKVFYCEHFAIRFSKANSKKMSNTVLSLSALQKYDNKPFFVCIVSKNENYILLANTTLLKKISHSSQSLTVDNIKGSFNGSDILDTIGEMKNLPQNFKDLFAIHDGFTFEENLSRLVEATNNIVGKKQKISITSDIKSAIMDCPQRAATFLKSDNYTDLNTDLQTRVSRVQNEIAISAFIENVNIRGRIIEFLITENDTTIKDEIIKALQNNTPIPTFKTDDDLGDYEKKYDKYHTKTDIKTKILFLDGNPKGYNIDKLLSFLSTTNSIYMIYLVGIDENKNIITRLCSVFDEHLIAATNIIFHWAGRNSRGVTQFYGKSLSNILNGTVKASIDIDEAKTFLNKLIDL